MKEEREISQVFSGQSQASSLILVDESAVAAFMSRDYAPALKAQGVSESGPPRPIEKLTVIAGMGSSEIVAPIYF